MSWLTRLRRVFAAKTGNRGDMYDGAALLERAIALHEAGNLGAAREIYADMLARDPRDADALHLSGVLSLQRGDNIHARHLIEKALEVRPAAPRFHFNLGNALAGLDMHGEAAKSYRRATELDSAHAPSWFNLGSALTRIESHREAVDALRHAFGISPDLPGLRLMLAQSLFNAASAGTLGIGAFAEAVALLRLHWQSAENPREARQLLAQCLQENHQWSEAAEHYLGLIEASPELEVAHNNLANCYNQLGRMDAAIAQYREVLRCSPENALAASAIVSCMNYASEATPATMLDEHVKWAKRFAPVPVRTNSHVNSRDTGRRLRVAYVSPDLRRHPVTTLFAPIIERHDKAKFEISCYYNYPREDQVTQRIRSAADHWVDIHRWNDITVSQQLRDDGIDILVDLGGHTSYGRLRAYAYKPAPVQISWLGYFATTGMAQMDAFITDPISSPPGQERWFSEPHLVRLPDTRFTFEPHEFYPPPGKPRQRTPGAVTFGCLNNLAKINSQVLNAWSAILERLPESSLLIQALALEDTPNRAAFLARCAAAGIAHSRIEIRPWTSLEVAASTYHDIDIALDPFPFCGGMTSFDALWMGVPVVTLAGELIAGRQTASILANLGLNDLVAENNHRYVDLAVSLAQHPDRLDSLRTSLRSTFAASALCDHDKFTRALEAAY
ncbi:MAG: tetratricopeptide repeat protein, partial [Burkholderiales bacterium]